MIVTGIDLGLTSLGLCSLGNKSIGSDALKLPKNRKGLDSMSLFINTHFKEDVNETIDQYIRSADLVVIEKPFKVMGHGKKLLEVLGIMEYLCQMADIPYVLVAQMTLKAFAANGRKFSTKKGQTKKDLSNFVVQDYNKEFDTEDETDAFWLANIGMSILDPKLFSDKRISLSKKLQVIDGSNEIIIAKDFTLD